MACIPWSEIVAAIDKIGNRVPHTDEYQRLCTQIFSHPAVEEMRDIDPFSDAYRDAAMHLYLDIRGREGTYVAKRDENIKQDAKDLTHEVVPWSFAGTNIVAEFLSSWSSILRNIDHSADKPARVLEYGPGTGQILLMLARLRAKAFGVDINASSIDLIRRQADQLGVEVDLEINTFGEGFDGERFDYILFFESFHHSFDFIKLLWRLHERLEPGGRIIFCGEPVVKVSGVGIALPWGPRLDGLSAFCVRQYGWMELGFMHDFFVEALQRCGWRVQLQETAGCARATTYIAQSVFSSATHLGTPFELGRFAPGWHGAEGTHRWTRASATYPLPAGGPTIDAIIHVSNPLPIARQLVVSCGEWTTTIDMPPGAHHDIEIVDCRDPILRFRCDVHRPVDMPELASIDDRELGIAVHMIEISRRS